ncbi:MAG TPA: response regulator transcription factor [Candidatus Limnocylindria bacterium]|nr:response regulator transcription factor [Candidatus Limnocylindria bacterium]
MSRRILVVEDDPGVRSVLDRGLRLAGYEPTLAVDIAGARARWAEGPWDLVLLDVMLPDGDGLDLLTDRRTAGDATPVVLLSAREETELRARAQAAGVDASIGKPFSYQELLDTVRGLAG